MNTQPTDDATADRLHNMTDDALPSDAYRARVAGQNWAEREWEAALDPRSSGGWLASDNDAWPLVSRDPSDEEEHELSEKTLARVANLAAEERWNDLIEDADVASNEEEVLARGYEALERELGPDGTLLFLTLVAPGTDDFVKPQYENVPEMLHTLGVQGEPK